MTIKDAQQDLRKSYFGGGPGAFASGIIWLFAGVTALVSTNMNSILVFFFGGMLIHPLGIIFSKLLKRSGKHQAGNPFSILAIETTFLLFIGLFIAFFSFKDHPNWFYAIMLLIIGGRYLLFSTVYGMRIYWLFGGVLILLGATAFFLNSTIYTIALAGGTTEIFFSILIIYQEKRSDK